MTTRFAIDALVTSAEKEPTEVGRILRVNEVGTGYIIEWTTPPSKILPFGGRNLEAWSFEDAATLTPLMTQTEVRAQLETMAEDLAEMIPHLAQGINRDSSIIALRRVRQYLAEPIIPADALEVLSHY